MSVRRLSNALPRRRPETIKMLKKTTFANAYANLGHFLTCMISIMMSTILYEDYVTIMLKTFKKTGICPCIRVPPFGRTLNLFCLKMVSRWPKMSQDGLRWSQDGQDGLRWPKMARRWPKMASSWPQVGSTWVIRRSWRWVSVDDVVQK